MVSWSRERHLKCPLSKNVKELPETIADSWFLTAGPQQLPNSILGEWQGADRPEAPRAMVTLTSQVSSDSKDSRVSSILIPLLVRVPTLISIYWDISPCRIPVMATDVSSIPSQSNSG